MTNQRVRKKKAESEKRSCAAWIRLTPAEAELLKSRSAACGQTQAAYLRNCFLGKTPVIVPEVNVAKFGESSKWASALSQLAKHLNSGEVAEDVAAVKALLSKFRAALLGL